MWWPTAKHAGVADPHAAAAATSGEIDAWTGGVAPVGGVDPGPAFFCSGVSASSCSGRRPFAGHCFFPTPGSGPRLRGSRGEIRSGPRPEAHRATRGLPGRRSSTGAAGDLLETNGLVCVRY